MLENQKKLEAVRMSIINHKICPELAVQARQLVFGDGNPEAEIVLIGEAPGKNEDIQGKPFVGVAGKFLNEMLDMINLQRKDVYITNIVKYRPPNNRDPLPDEKRAFLPYLQDQLAIIKPKLVITLGSHSLSCFLPSLKISQCHGQPKRLQLNLGSHLQEKGHEYQADSQFKQPTLSLVILPLFHPAAVSYNHSLRQLLIDDFANIPNILKQVKNYKMTVSKV